MTRYLSYYIHIPYCHSKCHYCNFDSKVGNYESKSKYIKSLKKEIEMAMEFYNLRSYKTPSIFIGGGTPTEIEENLLEILFLTVKETLIKNNNLEFTCESNPNTLTNEKLNILKKYGINRLSIGLQSANKIELEALGRTHSYEEFVKSFNLSRKLGFSNINIDLMFAIPHQTISSFENTVEEVIKLSPEHISLYGLIIEENTRIYNLYKNNPDIFPTDEYYNKMYELACEKLHRSGYIQYEISNFSKKGFECIHNVRYWENKNYLGFGKSAHSFFKNKRFYNVSDGYEEKIKSGNFAYSSEVEILDKKSLFEEWVMLRLRMNKGILYSEIDEKFGVNFKEKYNKLINSLLKRGLIFPDKKSLRLTSKGFGVSNKIILEIVCHD